MAHIREISRKKEDFARFLGGEKGKEAYFLQF